MKTAYICQREKGDLKNARDDIDEMMDNPSKSDDISFVSLADVPVKEYIEDVPVLMSNTDTCTISTSKSFTGSVTYRVIDEKSDVACLSQQIMEEREERSLYKEDALFIAVAWIVKPAFRLFKLCLEVIWVDVTSHSNNKGFHLLTFSS